MKKPEEDLLLEKIHLIITLIATLAVTVVCIIFPVPIVDLCIRLILTITVFYIIGKIVKKLFVKIYNEKMQIEKEKIEAENEAVSEHTETV